MICVAKKKMDMGSCSVRYRDEIPGEFNRRRVGRAYKYLD